MIQEFLSAHNINLFKMIAVAICYLLPIPLSVIALRTWHHYRQERFISNMKWVLVEIIVPRDVIKSPATMELIFSSAFYHKGGKNFFDQYISGSVWNWFSLEIVSIDGRVHFYIRVPTSLRNLVETQIYAQYPQAKVVEVEDYVFNIPDYKKNSDWNVWGVEFTKSKEDFLPIKTYKNFGDDLRTGIKEEYKIDPITPVIEFLGSLSKGQQIWIQMVVRQNMKKYLDKEGKKIDFHEAAAAFISKTLEPFSKGQKVEPGTMPGIPIIPDHVKLIAQSASEQMNKLHFDCGIRMMVLADKRICSDEQFGMMRGGAVLLFHQYSQPTVNEFKRVNGTGYDSAWQDPTGSGLIKLKKRLLYFYRTRTFFYPPIQYSSDYPSLLSTFFPSGSPKIFTLSSEELATIYHFPGMTSETPSFKRVESKIAKPPTNLPI